MAPIRFGVRFLIIFYLINNSFYQNYTRYELWFRKCWGTIATSFIEKCWSTLNQEKTENRTFFCFIVEQGIPNCMCDCSFIRPLILLRSNHQWKRKVSWNRQKVEYYSSHFAIPHWYHFNSAYHISDLRSNYGSLQSTYKRKVRIGIGLVIFENINKWDNSIC